MRMYIQFTIHSLRKRAYAIQRPSLDFFGLGGNRRGEAFMSYTARSWCEQAVFSKHPQQAEGCCNNRSSAFLVFLACQRSSKRPWSSASWRLVPCSAWQRFAMLVNETASALPLAVTPQLHAKMTLDLNDLQIFLLSRLWRQILNVANA